MLSLDSYTDLTFISKFLRQSIASLQKILWHNKLTSTSIYFNFIDKHVVEEFTKKW